MDWGQGRYERIAEELLPAAEEVIAVAAPRAGQAVADLGTGTGNAAVLAAERGARVIGIDPSERLLSVAAERARELDLDLDLRLGVAEEIPLADSSVDLITSVFGVIFAADASAAGAEMARIARPGGRIVLSAWIPGGAISTLTRIGREAIAAATGAPPGPPPFPWHEQEALAGLLGPHGFAVASEERSIAFRGLSPRRWFEEESRFHPMQVAAAGLLSAMARADLERRALEVLEAANEDPEAFQVTSRYAIATATRDG